MRAPTLVLGVPPLISKAKALWQNALMQSDRKAPPKPLRGDSTLAERGVVSELRTLNWSFLLK